MSSPYKDMREHIARYLASNGEDGHRFDNGTCCLVLTSTGRKSGEPRLVALVYGRTGGDYVVVASRGGADRHPDWFHNITADNRVRVQVGADVFEATARLATAEEYPAVWQQMVAIFPPYAEYQKKTARRIPVVILSPGSGE
ncbi:MAG TPA: nitroreductase family deazaflavin-dependent oxidoreductase [Spongiibacteraceae bacterium]|jgi:deazaflavin-dependent oxidoreductase (nitroreductase family)|nr:nitroreductase family deazaflavin-dependent oxidoreductase [Spongiibacteraceae bacterium]